MFTEIPEIRPRSYSKSAHSRTSSLHSVRSPASPFDPLSAALSTSQARYTISNGKSLKAHNNACHDLPGGNTRTVLHNSPFPITFVKGKGCELTSLDGDVYVDFLGEYTAGLYGHSNETIANTVSEALNGGWNYGGPNNYERQLAQKITQRFSPSGLEIVRFTNSGTEANTMALAAAVAFTGRKKILVFRDGYHGGTLSFPSILKATDTNLPHDFVIAPYNDIRGTMSIISKLPKDSLAAIIVEPVQGSGGCIVGQQDFLQYINTTAHKLGALFIVDEVMTSRLSYHGLSSALNLKPDLITLGKWVGGGMTFGAFGGRRDGGVMSLFDPRHGILSHSGTFNNNIISMAAGCAGLDIYTEDELQRLNALGDSLKSGVEEILSRSDITATLLPPSRVLEEDEEETPSTVVKSPPSLEPDNIHFDSLSINKSSAGIWISGQGSMLNIHFSGENEKDLKALYWHHMLESGIYLAQRGFIALNLELEEEHIQRFLLTTELFVSKYRQALGSIKGSESN